jgi:hypothetical protein
VCVVLGCRILVHEELSHFKKMSNQEEMKGKFREAVKCDMPERKHHTWHELVYCLNMLRITRDAHIDLVCYHNKILNFV